MSYSAVVLANTPALYLPLGVDATDQSGNGLDGTAVGSPTFGVAGPGGALAVLLNGTTQYITRADDNILDFPDPNVFTLEAWINVVSVANNPRILERTGGIRFYLASNRQVFVDKAQAGTITTSTTLITLLAWTHVVWTKSGTTSKIYINGVDVTGTVADQVMAAIASPMGVGAAHAGTTPLSGSLARLALYPTALTAADVLNHYNVGIATVPSTLTGAQSRAWAANALRLLTHAAGGARERMYTMRKQFKLVAPHMVTAAKSWTLAQHETFYAAVLD